MPQSDESHRPPHQRLTPCQLDLATLVRRCIAESERFAMHETHDTSFAYELFRRALVERDEHAWEHVYTLYQPLVGRWIRSHAGFGGSGESVDAFVVTAFARFWRAMPPERFAQFLTLGSLLQYLRRCADCAVLDGGRSRARAEQVPQTVLPYDSTPQLPDEEAYARVSSEEFWRFVTARLRGKAEREVVYGCFVLEMKPSDIFHQHQDLFASVQDVYRVKRNVLVRLGRDEELRQLQG